jgi:hypothetical protein
MPEVIDKNWVVLHCLDGLRDVARSLMDWYQVAVVSLIRDICLETVVAR